MNVLLVAGGDPKNWPDVHPTAFDYFVGIDHGSVNLLKAGMPLDLAVGDFDSLTSEEYQLVKKTAKDFLQAPAEKDDTDTQLALQKAVEKFPTATLTIIGATGGRLDHFLANLWLPMEPRFQPFIQQIKLLDQQNRISYYLPGTYTVTKEPEMKYLAYCCLTPVNQLTLKRSKYLLDNQHVPYPISYASNEFVEETADFSFDTGIIAVIQSKDN